MVDMNGEMDTAGVGGNQPRPRVAAESPRQSNTRSLRTPAYRQLLQGLYDAVLISDLDGNIVDGNNRAQEFLQLSAEELRSSSLTRLISGLNESVLGQIRGHLAAGRFTVLDATCVRKDGTSFPAEIAISRIALSARGNLVFSVRNIEGRKRMLERLRTEHNALQNCASAVAITDLEGLVQYANPAFISLWGGESRGNIVGRNIRELWQSGKHTPELVNKALSAQPWIGEIGLRRYDGKQLYLHATAAPNRDTNDRLVGLVFSFVDITEQHRAEEAIRKEAEVQISQVRHKRDFEGSLNIIGMADLLQLMDSTSKNGILTVTDTRDAEIGQVMFLEGTTVAATSGTASGENAIRALMRAEGSLFHFRECRPTERDPSITRSLTAMLLEATKEIDETDGP